jgi:DNA-directed RNA polymerase subunit RPC12/RpoP
MKRERCSQCGELVWITDDIQPNWKRNKDCPNCASRLAIERLRAETGPESRKKEAA